MYPKNTQCRVTKIEKTKRNVKLKKKTDVLRICADELKSYFMPFH